MEQRHKRGTNDLRLRLRLQSNCHENCAKIDTKRHLKASSFLQNLDTLETTKTMVICGEKDLQ